MGEYGGGFEIVAGSGVCGDCGLYSSSLMVLLNANIGYTNVPF